MIERKRWRRWEKIYGKWFFMSKQSKKEGVFNAHKNDLNGLLLEFSSVGRYRYISQSVMPLLFGLFVGFTLL